jgi:hypothetical protein
MKKIYITPLAEVVKINAEQMICESIDNVNRAINTSSTVSAGSALGKDDIDYDEDLW